MIAPTFDILTGRAEFHVDTVPGTTFKLHRDAMGPFARFSAAAAKAGFELKIASSFRNFATQLRIWNEKAEGKRPLLDKNGNPLKFETLDSDAIVSAILRWSALPGASRHHWGTDFDIFPGNLAAPDYRVQLSPQEVAAGGVFEEFGDWLDDTLPLHGFYRPYEEDRGGVSPEWWHLSYAPTAEIYQRAFTLDVLKQTVAASDLRLKEVVQKNLDTIYSTYIDNVAEPTGA